MKFVCGLWGCGPVPFDMNIIALGVGMCQQLFYKKLIFLFARVYIFYQ